MTTDDSLESFMEHAKDIGECLHAYGVHSYTLQPELVNQNRIANTTAATADTAAEAEDTGVSTATQTTRIALRSRENSDTACRVRCQTNSCVSLQCCD